MSIDNRPIKNYPRNTPARSSISSMQLNDQLDEIYYELVELTGYQDNAGTISPEGEITELSNSLTGDGSAKLTFTDDDTSARIPMFGSSEISPSGIIIEDSLSILEKQNQLNIYLARYRANN